MARLVTAGETEVVVLTVDLDVLGVALAELLNGVLNGLHAALLAHRLGRVVGVASSTVPVTGDGLGVEGDLDAPLLGHTEEEVTGDDEGVTHLDALGGPTWNSHWAGMTSALMPEMLMPAWRQQR